MSDAMAGLAGQWEYHTERPGSIDDESMAMLLNSLGESGWEYAGSYGNVMIFKRRLA